MALVDTLAVVHLLPTPNGACVASVAWWGDAAAGDVKALLAAPWKGGLARRVQSRLPPLALWPRCAACLADLPDTFQALALWVGRGTDGSVAVADRSVPDRWLCLGCNKHSHAARMDPLSAHAALAVLRATQQRAPIYFTDTFVESDTYVRS